MSAAPAAGARAPLIEVFWSVQGEGRYVGVPMAFLRTATCPIRCRYCDTPHSYAAAPRFGVQVPPRGETGAAGAFEEQNPVTAARARELVLAVLPADATGVARRVSVTGGEPLVFPDFVRDLGERLRGDSVRVSLETAALDADALQRCIAVVDHLSADYKLSSTLHPAAGAAHGEDHGEQHVACCEVALAHGASVDVKLVLTPGVRDEEFAQALARLRPLRDRVLLVLQPVTPFGAEPAPLPAARLFDLLLRAQSAGFDARVLPQVHKTLLVP